MTSEGLKHYAARLREWNTKINLVSPDTLKDLEQRHWLDCAQLIDYLPTESVNILDLGTGAGLPGLVLAILAPQHRYTLVESDSRKCAFLHTIVQDLKLPQVEICNQRVESLNRHHQYDVITARAFAPLEKILTMSEPFLKPEGCWLLLKGAAVDEELRTCETLFPMTVEQTSSRVLSSKGETGWVLKIKRS